MMACVPSCGLFTWASSTPIASPLSVPTARISGKSIVGGPSHPWNASPEAMIVTIATRTCVRSAGLILKNGFPLPEMKVKKMIDEYANQLVIAILTLYVVGVANEKGLELHTEDVRAILDPIIFLLDLADDTMFDTLSECELGTLFS